MTDHRSPRPARFGRRHALHGLVAGSIGLPWLETVAPRPARGGPAQSDPIFVVMFSANGTIADAWTPTGGERDFVLSPILEPLAPHRDALVVLSGIDQQGAGGDGHQTGIGGMLTGAPLLPGRFGGGAGSAPAGWASGPSIDQRIADVVGDSTPFRSLELAVRPGPADNWGRMIYRGANRPIAPHEQPSSAFDALFGLAALPEPERRRLQARRTSVLDYLRDDLEALAGEVSATDRQRLEAHTTLLRDLETRLSAQTEALGQCTLPSRPPSFDNSEDGFEAIGEAHADLLAIALACGRTRVASLQWSRSVSPVRFTWLGIPEGHHELSHRPDDDPDARDKLVRINRWYAERFAGLIDRLAAYPEGDGTLFDRCLLLWCNELARGNTHTRENASYLLAGSAGGALETGRFLSYDDQPHNDLLLSLGHAMGLSDTSFGNEDWCTGPLPRLL